MTATPIFPQTIVTSVAKIAPADASNLKTLYTASANGSRIDSIIVTSTDTNSRDLQFIVTISGVDYILGTITIPANTGTNNSTPIKSVLENAQFAGLPSDVNGNHYTMLASGAVLKVKSLSTVTTAKEISIFAQGGNF
jgi:hypothetical protein